MLSKGQKVMDRNQKKDLVSDMNAVFGAAESVVVVHCQGLTVEQSTDLRAKLREAGAGFKVTKNRLTKLALKGTDYEGLDDLFTGPTAIAYSDEFPVAPAKIVYEFAKENDKVEILGGALGTNVLDKDRVEDLAKLPSLDELRGKLVGMIQTPAIRIARLSAAPATQVARVIGAYAAKGE